MKILLVSPTPGYKSSYERKSRPHPPLSCWRLKKWIESRTNHEIDVFNASLKEPSKFVENNGENYDLVGITSYYITAFHDMRIGQLFKQKNERGTLVYGGINPTFEPELYYNYGEADYVVRGDGEKDFINILEGVKPLNQGLREEDWQESTMNINFKETDIKECWKESRSSGEEKPASVRIVTEDYCPRGCRFCSSTNLFNGKPRMLTSEQVAQKVFEVDELGADRVLFQGDSFIWGRQGRERLKKLADMELGESIDCDVMTQLDIRDLFSKPREIISQLKKLNVTQISTGIESFSDNTLKDMGKKGSSQQKIEDTLEILVSEDVNVFANIILSSPKTTVNDITHTVDRIKSWMDQGLSLGINVPMLYFKGAEIASNGEGYIENECIEINGDVIERPNIIWPENKEARALLQGLWNDLSDLHLSSPDLSKVIVDKVMDEFTLK